MLKFFYILEPKQFNIFETKFWARVFILTNSVTSKRLYLQIPRTRPIYGSGLLSA